MLTPRSSARRASRWNLSSFAIEAVSFPSSRAELLLGGGLLRGRPRGRRGDLREDVVLGEDEQVIALELHLGATVLRVDDLVALGDLERNPLAIHVAEI